MGGESFFFGEDRREENRVLSWKKKATILWD
jgi:hypothetical protein